MNQITVTRKLDCLSSATLQEHLFKSVVAIGELFSKKKPQSQVEAFDIIDKYVDSQSYYKGIEDTAKAILKDFFYCANISSEMLPGILNYMADSSYGGVHTMIMGLLYMAAMTDYDGTVITKRDFIRSAVAAYDLAQINTRETKKRLGLIQKQVQ